MDCQHIINVLATEFYCKSFAIFWHNWQNIWVGLIENNLNQAPEVEMLKVSKSRKQFWLFSILQKKDEKQEKFIQRALRIIFSCSSFVFWKNWWYQKSLLRFIDLYNMQLKNVPSISKDVLEIGNHQHYRPLRTWMSLTCWWV